jgi:hypothetical protein
MIRTRSKGAVVVFAIPAYKLVMTMMATTHTARPPAKARFDDIEMKRVADISSSSLGLIKNIRRNN